MEKKLNKEASKTRYDWIKTSDQDFVYSFKLEDGDPIAVIVKETSMRKSQKRRENQKHMTGNVSKDRPRKMFNEMEIELVSVPGSLQGLGHLLDIQSV